MNHHGMVTGMGRFLAQELTEMQLGAEIPAGKQPKTTLESPTKFAKYLVYGFVGVLT